jgi:hypothetical protein
VRGAERRTRALVTLCGVDIIGDRNQLGVGKVVGKSLTLGGSLFILLEHCRQSPQMGVSPTQVFAPDFQASERGIT